MKKRNVLWAVFLIIAAASIVLGQLNIFIGIGFWSIALTALFGAFLINSIADKSPTGIIFSLAFLTLIWEKQLGIVGVSAWAILVAALLLSIGVGILYHPKHDKYRGQFSDTTENVGGDNLEFSTSFGSSIKYVQSDNFNYAHVDCSFGDMKIYMDNAVINDGATIDMKVSFGGLELYVPRNWRVVCLADASFGGVDEKNTPDPVTTAALTLTGRIKFGGITIIYI